MWKVVFSVLVAALAIGLGSGSLVGGLRTIDTNNPRVQNALNFAVLHHNRGTNDIYRSDVSEVVTAQYQLVAGMKYIITVRMARTTCRKESTNEHCPLFTELEQARPYTCVFTVWDRPWLNSLALLKEECS